VLPEELKEHAAAVAVEDAVVTGKFDRGELTLEIAPDRIVEVCGRLKHEHGYARMSDLTAVDRYPEEPRFEIIYHLHSLTLNARLRLKCRLPGEHPSIDSVTSIWRGANWYEREVFDLFGVVFRNHPELTRIMMPADWEGHPLRKDYPILGPRG
jgi:NADH-quinone oxidoreductase subunit C